MRILVIADIESKALWDYFDKSMLENVDLIVSCGDLNPKYLSFLATFTKAPVIYVRGNHDANYEMTPPDGCICIEDDIFEISDIHRFSTPNKLLAFAGLDPSVHPSGNFQAKRTRMSKRGSRVLHFALMNVAHNVVKNNLTFKTYYDKKRAEGHSHYNALGHCSGKLVRVIWKMLTDNVEFNLE